MESILTFSSVTPVAIMTLTSIIILLLLMYVFYDDNKIFKKQNNKIEDLKKSNSVLTDKIKFIEMNNLGDIRTDLLAYLDSIISTVGKPYMDINIRYGNLDGMNSYSSTVDSIRLRGNVEMREDIENIYNTVMLSLSDVYVKRLHYIFASPEIWEAIINDKVKSYYMNEYNVISKERSELIVENEKKEQERKKTFDKKIRTAKKERAAILNTLLRDTDIIIHRDDSDTIVNKKLEATRHMCIEVDGILSEMNTSSGKGLSDKLLLEKYGKEAFVLHKVRSIMKWRVGDYSKEDKDKSVMYRMDFETARHNGTVQEGMLVS